MLAYIMFHFKDFYLSLSFPFILFLFGTILISRPLLLSLLLLILPLFLF